MNSDDFGMRPVQSPIAISSRDTKIADNVHPLEFHGHWNCDGAFIENTGISAKVTLNSRKQQPFICGGHLPPNSRYIFEELHFHWTERDDSGCEHRINGLS